MHNAPQHRVTRSPRPRASSRPWMRRTVSWLALAALCGWAVVGAWASAPRQGASVLVSEVMYDPAVDGSEARYEWVELHNPGDAPLPVEGWSIRDNRGTDALPAIEIPAGGYIVVAADQGFRELNADFAGEVVFLDGRIGNGLGNTGDRVEIVSSDGMTVDGMSYGDDAGVLDPAADTVAEGHALARDPAGRDTDSAADWHDSLPSPGGPPSGAPAETTVPSPVRTATVGGTTQTPQGGGAEPVLNEVLPAPAAVDWDGSGTADGMDEWVELYNASDVEADLRGWQLDDVEGGGSSPFAFPADERVPPRGFLVLYRSVSKVALNNDGDVVRLLRPDGSVADVLVYDRAAPDTSFARMPDGDGPWGEDGSPSPGEANALETGPTPSATGGRTAPSTTAPLPSTTAPSPTVNPGTGSATPQGKEYLPLLITEVLFDPVKAGSDADAEWVEIFNPGGNTVRLAGWAIGDRVASRDLPAVMLAPGGFAVVYAGDRPPALPPGALAVPAPQGRIGNGLSNDGDVVRLRDPTGAVSDAVSFGANLDAFDPAVPIGPPGSSIERIPAAVDTNRADDWWVQEWPSPGREGDPPAGPPQIRLSEILPEPRGTDWNGDGNADHEDEWIELENPGERAVDLGGWRIVVGEDRYRATLHGSVPAKGFRVLHRLETDLHLGDDADRLTLIRSDGVTQDSFAWAESPGADLTWGRVDGSWEKGLEPTPGQANRAATLADADASAHSEATSSGGAASDTWSGGLGSLAGLTEGRRVAVKGVIIAAPGRLGASEFYIADDTGGVRVYLGKDAASAPELGRGDLVQVSGSMDSYFGEGQIDAAPAGVARVGRGPLPDVRRIATGSLGSSEVGVLLRVRGRVTAWSSTGFTLDDGSGPAQIVLRSATGLRRPFLRQGEVREIVGIGGRYARGERTGGYRVMPRDAADLRAREADVREPAAMPATGSGPGR